MSADASPVLSRLAVLASALLAGIAFLYMVKLMHDISDNVGLMAAEMGQMRRDMSSLAEDISAMRQQVGTLPAIAQDMGRMRVSMERLSGIVGAGEDMPAVNPMGVLQQMIPAR